MLRLPYFSFLISCFLFALSSCSVSKKISRDAHSILLSDSSISQGHIGISIYDPSSGNYLYNYNADKYFIPASNTKLFTLYAGMKYLGDSLIGVKYLQSGDSLYFLPTGDPTFLHPDFKSQPLYDFLKAAKLLFFIPNVLRTEKLGQGWSWDDYQQPFMPERSPFPMYGNIATIKRKFSLACTGAEKMFAELEVFPHYLYKREKFDGPGFKNMAFVDKAIFRDFLQKNKCLYLDFNRDLNSNRFHSEVSINAEPIQKIPFATDSLTEMLEMLKDTLHRNIDFNGKYIDIRNTVFKKYYSQPTDSLLQPMMHRSDNFFAEQTLLMVCNELLGHMSDKEIIDSLLRSGLEDVPQKPRWVDGSGLSRYNLFTPRDFIYILNKMKNEFGIERLKNILPTGGEGTLKDYFITDSSFIYAKTGTLSNNCALSGFLITKKSRLLIFSVLVNNYISSAAPVRRAVEQFLKMIREKY